MTEQSAIRWDQDADGVVTLTLDDPTQSANTMNALYQASMEHVVERLRAEVDGVKGVLITSAKKSFFAGGDLRLLSKATRDDAPEVFANVRALNAQLRALETLGRPVVAAINGTALGGGLEIALACHHRVVIDDPRTRLGLPEVTLGLLPGGGGIVRTVRMLGIQKAVTEVLIQGQRMKPAKALALGLVDELASDRDAMLEKARAWIDANPSPKQPWDDKGYRVPGGTPKQPAFAANLPAFPANLKKQLKGAPYPAPRAILAAAVEGAAEDFDTASKIESRYFVELVVGEVSKNMTKAFFFDLQKIESGASRPDGFERRVPTRVGVLGAGMMGQGIAYVSAMAGVEVALKDVSVEAAERGKAYTDKLLRKRVSKGAMSEADAAAVLARIHPTAEASGLDGCDMIIEAVFEDRALKAKVTEEAEAHATPDALVCSNTSTLPITGLAKASKHPERFIGLHFFSPVDKMPLVEIIVGERTSDETLARAFDYVRAIKKTPIVVNDSRGFFTSRVFGTYAMEGVAMLGEGLNPASIEQAATQNGMPVGPLAVTDEVSLELTRHVREQTKRDLEAEGKRYTPHPADAVIDRMCDDFGRTGRAAGAGFYDYPEGGKKHLWAGLREHFGDAESDARAEASFGEMRDRLLYVQSLETIRCLEEGVLRSVADANIGSIFGIGAPPWTGGLLQYVNYVGLRAFAERARELAAKHGARFEPPQLLIDKAERGETFE
ncbi:MAG: enoyl-CoA hydratase/isomerase family protein [Myxococcales bacterium]|nr:enoyl-CoA hydratase/isomerase family protein [Myxococcales bacterium]